MMKKSTILVLFLLAAVMPARADDRQVTLSMTSSEAQTMLNKLSESPWRDINPLMQKLIAQLNAQLTWPQPAPPPAPPPAPTPPPAEQPEH